MSATRQSPQVSAADLQLPLGFEGAAQPVALHPLVGDAASVLALLDAWYQAGWLQHLDVRFARFLHDQQPQASGLLLLAAALCSHQLARGHVCLDLDAMLKGPRRVLDLPPDVGADSPVEHPTPSEVLANMQLSDWEGCFDPEIVSDGSRVTPLVYAGGRLYLYRYWRHEQHVGAGITCRLGAAPLVETLPAARLRPVLDALFETADGVAPDWQRLACALATRNRFSVVTGGPGTGKTTTVVRLLALLQALQHEQSRADDPDADASWLRIRLAAPTGKAAARLSESVASKVNELPFDRLPGGERLADAIPVEVVTVHRLLGGRPHLQARRYHAGNPLPLDVLVIDEASMVSLADMSDVAAALPAHARLILIGDKDQLSSVEAGAVLGEICRRADAGHYLPEVAAWLEEATGMRVPSELIDSDGSPLDQAVVMLRFSHRFGQDSGIGRLAAAVNEGRADEALNAFDASPHDLAHLRVQRATASEFEQLVVEGVEHGGNTSDTRQRLGYGHYLAEVAREPEGNDPQMFDAWAASVLTAQRACQVLCVLRAGPWGVHGLNKSIAGLLHARGLIPAQQGWYVGRPVMVTRNNPSLNLTNGDIGVVLRYPVDDTSRRVLRVAFINETGGVRWFAPNRLDDVETVYALTVHKSQGSEFEHAVLVLPPASTPVLTRELIYTGITRASRGFTLVSSGDNEVFRQAVTQRVYRSGGLGDVLSALRYR